MDEKREDHQVGRPRVNGADQPAELHLAHEKLHRFEGLLRARPVVQQEQNARGHLHHEQEEGHAAEVVPDGVPVDGDLFLPGKLLQVLEPDAPVEPLPESAETLRAALHGQALLLTTIWFPRTLTT